MMLADVPTPALVVDRGAFDHNVAAMAAVHPGARLRPHVKAFKSTALAGELAAVDAGEGADVLDYSLGQDAVDFIA